MERVENAELVTEEKGKGMFLDYLPAIVALLMTVITTVLYFTVMPERYFSTTIGLPVIAVIPFGVVFVNRWLKLQLPRLLIILMCAHAVMTFDLGSTLGFYGRFPWWDTAFHAFFGTLAGATLYYLYIRIKHEKPGLIDCIVMVMLVLSFAALWEVYEFGAGDVFNSDMQDVQRSIEVGINPLTDTMVDMCVATAGALFFFVLYAVKKFLIDRRKKMKQQ